MILKNSPGCCTALGLVLFSSIYIALLHAEEAPTYTNRDRFYSEVNGKDRLQKDGCDKSPDNTTRIRENNNSINKDESNSRNSGPTGKVSGRGAIDLIQKDEVKLRTIVNANERVTGKGRFQSAPKKSHHLNHLSRDDCEREKVDSSAAKTSANRERFTEQTKLGERTRNTESDKRDKKRQNTVDGNQVERKKKERVKEFWRRAIARDANRIGATKQTVQKKPKTDEKPLHRSKRWEYYDTNYNWENDGADYNTPDSASKKETKFEKWAKDWQKHALRFIFIFSFIMMFVCCCCAGCKKFFSRLCFVVCLHCKDWRDVCLNRDPTYRMMRKQADEYGIKLDYEEYKRIKNSYEQSLKKHGYSNVDISGR